MNHLNDDILSERKPKKNKATNYNVTYNKSIGAITVWVLAFWGDPDLMDAIITHLMRT